MVRRTVLTYQFKTANNKIIVTVHIIRRKMFLTKISLNNCNRHININ